MRVTKPRKCSMDEMSVLHFLCLRSPKFAPQWKQKPLLFHSENVYNAFVINILKLVDISTSLWYTVEVEISTFSMKEHR